MFDYHDATLKSILLDWEGGVTRLIFALCAQPTREVAVTMQETSDLKCERQFPWGESSSVNRLEVQRLESQCRVEIELQSGDRVIILGKEFSEKVNE